LAHTSPNLLALLESPSCLLLQRTAARARPCWDRANPGMIEPTHTSSMSEPLHTAYCSNAEHRHYCFWANDRGELIGYIEEI
jgi:hypothetical protein